VGSMGDEFKFYVVLNTECLLRKFGGLGIRKLKPFNHALLGKWRFGL
jgi:hypothetical protein